MGKSNQQALVSEMQRSSPAFPRGCSGHGKDGIFPCWMALPFIILC